MTILLILLFLSPLTLCAEWAPAAPPKPSPTDLPQLPPPVKVKANLTRPPGTNVPPRTNFTLIYQGAFRGGGPIAVLFTTNLSTTRSNWTVITNITPTNHSPPVQFTTPLTTNRSGFLTVKTTWP
jgi:hypothetical protein